MILPVAVGWVLVVGEPRIAAPLRITHPVSDTRSAPCCDAVPNHQPPTTFFRKMVRSAGHAQQRIRPLPHSSADGGGQPGGCSDSRYELASGSQSPPQPHAKEIKYHYQSEDRQQHGAKAVPAGVFLIGVQLQADPTCPDIADDGGGT